MSLEGERRRHNYSFGCGTSKPNGCLISPEGSKIIFFEECKNPLKTNFKIHTHIFYTNHLGEPAGFKSSESLSIDAAWREVTRTSQKGWIETFQDYG